MICKLCAWAADEVIVKILDDDARSYEVHENKHCDTSGCTCQHKERGSWRGLISTNSSESS